MSVTIQAIRLDGGDIGRTLTTTTGTTGRIVTIQHAAGDITISLASNHPNGKTIIHLDPDDAVTITGATTP